MATLNQVSCASNVSNTGFGSCYLDMKNIIGAFIVPNGYTLSSVELNDLYNTLATDKRNVSKLQRIYPIHDFVAVTSNTEDKTVQTFGYGNKAVVREGKMDWSYQFVKGGLALHKALRSFNSNGLWSVLFYDADYNLFGKKVGTGLGGIETDFIWTSPWTPNDGGNFAVYNVQFVFNPEDINENLGFVQADSRLADVKGLEDVEITVTGINGSLAGIVVKIQTASGADLFDVYQTEIANINCWDLTKASGGGAITIASVSASPTTKEWQIFPDNTDPDFPAVGQVAILNLKPTADLELRGISNIESKAPVQVTRPA